MQETSETLFAENISQSIIALTNSNNADNLKQETNSIYRVKTSFKNCFTIYTMTSPVVYIILIVGFAYMTCSFIHSCFVIWITWSTREKVIEISAFCAKFPWNKNSSHFQLRKAALTISPFSIFLNFRFVSVTCICSTMRIFKFLFQLFSRSRLFLLSYLPAFSSIYSFLFRCLSFGWFIIIRQFNYTFSETFGKYVEYSARHDVCLKSFIVWAFDHFPGVFQRKRYQMVGHCLECEVYIKSWQSWGKIVDNRQWSYNWCTGMYTV